MRRSPDARLVLAIVTVVSTVGFNFHVILPLLASDTLDTGPRSSASSACFGGGALVGALLSAALGRASWKVLVLGTGGFSLCLLALAPLAAVVPCAILLFGAGVCFTLWTSNASSILQLRAPDHLRGRVVSLYLWAFAGLAPLGGLLAGWLCSIGGRSQLRRRGSTGSDGRVRGPGLSLRRVTVQARARFEELDSSDFGPLFGSAPSPYVEGTTC